MLVINEVNLDIYFLFSNFFFFNNVLYMKETNVTFKQIKSKAENQLLLGCRNDVFQIYIYGFFPRYFSSIN